MQRIARVCQRQLILVDICERTDRQTDTLTAILRHPTRRMRRYLPTVGDIQHVNDGPVDISKQRVRWRPEQNLELLRRFIFAVSQKFNRPRHRCNACSTHDTFTTTTTVLLLLLLLLRFTAIIQDNLR